MADKTIILSKDPSQLCQEIPLIEGDNNTYVIRFVAPRYSGGVDLANLTWGVNIKNATLEQGFVNLSSSTSDDSAVYIDWNVGSFATVLHGSSFCTIEGRNNSSSAHPVWKSSVVTLRVGRAISADDIIDGSDIDSITEIAENVAESIVNNSVRYDTSQSLNSTQKTTARTNIGATSQAEVQQAVAAETSTREAAVTAEATTRETADNEIKSALDDISVIESDNLLHLLNKTQTINGVTVTTDKENNVVLNGTATSNGGRLFFFSDPFTLPAGTYTIGQVITDNTSQPMFNKFVVNVTKTSDDSLIASAASSAIPPTPASFTLAENTEIAVGFSVLAGNTYNNTKCAVMLNAGSTILPYEPPNKRAPKYEDIILSAFADGGVISENLSEYRTEMRRYLINTSFHPTDLPDDSINYGNLIVFPNQPNIEFTGQFLIDGNSIIYYRVINKNSGSVVYDWRVISKRYGEYVNALTGKLWYACGDSFTQGDFTGTETPTIGGNGRYRNQKPTYPYWIGTRADVVVSSAFAVNGATLAKRTDGSTGYEFCEHYTDVSASVDYITLYFGINDSYRTTLGTPADTTKNTFYGALDLILKYYTENRPNTKIGIIATNAGNPNTISGYIEAVKTVAVRYGVPCLDMNSTDHMLVISSNNPNVSASAKETALTKYRVADGNNHPNALCHKLQSNFIEEWLLTL